MTPFGPIYLTGGASGSIKSDIAPVFAPTEEENLPARAFLTLQNLTAHQDERRQEAEVLPSVSLSTHERDRC